MLPSIATHERIGGLSGLSLALGNVSGLLLLVFMLLAFVLPGAVGWSFIPSHPLFGIDQSAHEPERLTGPISALCASSSSRFRCLSGRRIVAKRTVSSREASSAGIRSVLRTMQQP